jgi:polar amino acid transport system substrate-binding protein
MFKKTAIFAWIFWGMVISAADAQPRLRIAYPYFPPFHWLTENNVMAGFFYEIMTEALEKRMGLTVVWTAYPWIRCQENLKEKMDDAVLTVPTAQRALYTVTHKDPFYQKSLNLFTYVDHKRWAEIRKIKKIADLKKGGFSVITYSGNGWHQENVQPLGIKTYETAYLENVWKMLAQKRGDTVIEWPPGAWPDIRRAGVPDRVVDTSNTLSAMPFHLLIRNDYPQADHLLAGFNETLRGMKADGAMKVILSKYY